MATKKELEMEVRIQNAEILTLKRQVEHDRGMIGRSLIRDGYVNIKKWKDGVIIDSKEYSLATTYNGQIDVLFKLCHATLPKSALDDIDALLTGARLIARIL